MGSWGPGVLGRPGSPGLGSRVLGSLPATSATLVFDVTVHRHLRRSAVARTRVAVRELQLPAGVPRPYALQPGVHARAMPGYWAVRVDEGAYGDVPLAGLKALIAFDCPQHMIEGNWTEVVIIDEAASPAAARSARDHPHWPGGRLVGAAGEVRRRAGSRRGSCRSSSRKSRTRSGRASRACSTRRSPRSRAAIARSR